MKRLIVLLLVIGVLSISSTQAQNAVKIKPVLKKPDTQQPQVTPKTQVTVGKETKKEKAVKGAKPTTGVVVSLNKLVMGDPSGLKKDEAQKLADQGSPIVLLVGKGKGAKIYFVYNSDGSFAGKNLAKLAENKTVGVVGKVQTINGLKIIRASHIE
ncbi:MAG: hypothetical protein ABSG15_07935 [FCB group bacterium]|jgi:hypothetical protein